MTAFGYGVDLYDLVIFGVVRIASLRELGLTDGALTRWGVWLLDIQMVGLLLGGLFWGWLGDRFGRRPALIGAVALYSVANLASSTIGGLPSYALLRFIAGFGLAGELGAGVTLITESLPPNRRGYGATIVATVGPGRGGGGGGGGENFCPGGRPSCWVARLGWWCWPRGCGACTNPRLSCAIAGGGARKPRPGRC